MPTREEIHELGIEKVMNRALSQIADGGGELLAAARDGSGFPEAVDSGTYDSDDNYLKYEQFGDEIGVYPLAP